MNESAKDPGTTSQDEMVKNRRKAMFGDCRLIEIIHLHDCLRGALAALVKDVEILTEGVLSEDQHREVETLERRVAGRFKVIWSVFRAHSAAEDEFIWPALKRKTDGRVGGSPVPGQNQGDESSREKAVSSQQNGSNGSIVQEEYEEDHADEERMFSEMDTLLSTLHEMISKIHPQAPINRSEVINAESDMQIGSIAQDLRRRTSNLSQHLMVHLDKEESECLPLVIKHLSKAEIHDLVGQIMGKRSADTIAQIMTMAVQNLETKERLDMVKYMKECMSGTFFDRWLMMSGWTGDTDDAISPASSTNHRGSKRKDHEDRKPAAATGPLTLVIPGSTPGMGVTSQAELEKLIRVVATNQSLTSSQKNTTIQGLRDSVWRSNKRLKEKMGDSEGKTPTVVNTTSHVIPAAATRPLPVSHDEGHATSAHGGTSLARRVTPPSSYYRKDAHGSVKLVWSAEKNGSRPSDEIVPLFSTSELAPTFHDGAAGAVLGCPHYARACKLRHPKSGRLYTCRLCCEQDREMPMKEKDVALDRYAVTEVLCMKCNVLQPAEDRCINSDCDSHRKPFARYYCKICHLYDDNSRPIFHCPYCNTCRLGRGLGIDFRHCMRCNACVSLADTEHRCIPQKLQGSCPICHESLFNSTEALRGLKCGHVMHLSCYTEYRRDHSYTCPLCKVSMEDMSDYFAMLDAAIRMQPMPAAYLSTMSNIFCQDCGSTGQVKFHFVGQKCLKCNSYNTREMSRVEVSPRSSPLPR